MKNTITTDSPITFENVTENIESYYNNRTEYFRDVVSAFMLDYASRHSEFKSCICLSSYPEWNDIIRFVFTIPEWSEYFQFYADVSSGYKEIWTIQLVSSPKSKKKNEDFEWSGDTEIVMGFNSADNGIIARLALKAINAKPHLFTNANLDMNYIRKLAQH
jgi:hypothetical protein